MQRDYRGRWLRAPLGRHGFAPAFTTACWCRPGWRMGSDAMGAILRPWSGLRW